MVDAQAPAVTGLNCPNCGVAIEVRSGELAQTVACSSCHALLDAHDPNLRVLQQYSERMTWTPLIPLGTRGKLKGEMWEAIGFQVRSITVEGTDYFWSEYLLWNPYRGFRYLSEYQGHWNDITVLKTTPDEKVSGRQPIVELLGETFRHFQSAVASTRFVLGEFPWEVRLNDHVSVRDFVSPPHMLSCEMTPEETTWSLGTYTAPGRIWEAFKLPGKPPRPVGVYENQPDPYTGRWKELMSVFAVFLVLLIGFYIVRTTAAQNTLAFTRTYSLSGPGGDSAAFVTPTFRLSGRTSNVQVNLTTNLSNNWAYFGIALINETTGTAYDFGREVSYYYGRDTDGSWHEGSTSDKSYLAAIPSGRYYLRIQPELGRDNPRPLLYGISLRRDVPRTGYFFVVLLLLAIPPIFLGIRYWSFEQARWNESDYAPDDSEDE